MYNNIERFYSENRSSLIEGDLRPVVSYNKDAEEYINKLVEIYNKLSQPEYITVGQIAEGLGVATSSNVATVESPLTWISLGLIEEGNDGLTKKDTGHKYFFTDDFKSLAIHNMIPGVHILNKLYGINGIESVTKFINLLLCSLREGYIKGGIIDFPRENQKYIEKVPSLDKRSEYSKRIFDVYGYAIDTDASPHASMRAINNLTKLELISQTRKTEEGFPVYELTPYAHRLLSTIDKSLASASSSTSIISVPSRTHSLDGEHSNIFNALRTKPFLLIAGISGTGKSRIVRELAFRSCPEKLQDKDCTTPGNYLMIEVKPNWHDSSELLGYYSNISKNYHFTKFIDFLVLAHNNKDVPFFVCLDEMNLAPVEQYFAEFLSVLETRRYPKTDTAHIKSGALVDKKHMDTYGDGWPTGEDLTLPDNVFIIGTVNMDDTTHQFSRKVIDRAMTIEMNGGDLESMFGNSNNLSYTNDWTLADFKPKYVQADEVLAVHGSNPIKEDAPAKLEAINACLEGTPFEVSYRVLNELCVYIGVLLDSGVEYNKALDQAVDQITLMKILPRIEGDEDMFRIPKEEKNRLDKLRTLFNEDTETYKKLGEMISRLDNGFTRFWP